MTESEMDILTARIPVSLVEKLDELADRLERSREWIVEQALSTWIAEQDRDRLTHEALADVDDGAVIDQQLVRAWAVHLTTNEPK